MTSAENRDNRGLAYVSIPQIRLIELVAIFCIVYVARELAGFSYKAGLILLVFLGSAFLNLLVAGLENRIAGYFRSGEPAKEFWNWTTVTVDLVTVLALIYFTGTVRSPFLFLVVVPLFFAGRLLPAWVFSR